MKRTSPLTIVALAVAMLALVASMGGASYAAKLITGKDIKNGSITGTDVKNKSLTGSDVKNSSLTGADVKNKTLTGADVKDGSIAAGDLKDGVIPPGLEWKQVTATSGASADAARTAAPEQVLFTAGGFTVYGKCYTDASGPTTYAYAYVKTAQNGAIVDSEEDDFEGGATADFLNTDTLEVDRELVSTSASANDSSFYGSHSTDFAAFGADGTALSGFTPVAAKNGTLAGGNGPFGAGDSCLFSSNISSND